jgi:chromosome partitioning related protein ParA
VIVYTLCSTKGGVGKTTLAANMGGLLADLGLRVLMIDADIQPSLSKYYETKSKAPVGIYDVVTRGSVTENAISTTVIDNLDLIYSDATPETNNGEANLQNWLASKFDSFLRIRMALKSPVVTENYDVVIIDTQGAQGPLQDAAILAADQLIAPIPPSIIDAREFYTSTINLLNRFDTDITRCGPLKAVLYRMDRTKNAKVIAGEIRKDLRAFLPVQQRKSWLIKRRRRSESLPSARN